jgi:hypothetical protein
MATTGGISLLCAIAAGCGGSGGSVASQPVAKRAPTQSPSASRARSSAGSSSTANSCDLPADLHAFAAESRLTPEQRVAVLRIAQALQGNRVPAQPKCVTLENALGAPSGAFPRIDRRCLRAASALDLIIRGLAGASSQTRAAAARTLRLVERLCIQ